MWSVFEALDNVLYSDWLRENVHWFTPIIPLLLLTVALHRRESKAWIAATVLVVLAHYGILYALDRLARAGASVWKLL